MAQQAEAIVIREPWAVSARLAQLSLTKDILDDTRAAWSAAEASASPFEPITAPGLKGWIAAVGVFREALSMSREWEAQDVHCCPLMANAAKSVAICITSGDERTGSPEEDVCPTTKNPKGIVLGEAVRVNMEQMELDFGPHYRTIKRKPRNATIAPMTWVLMVYTTAHDVMAELSLPAAIEGGYIVKWHQRIVLPPMSRQNPPPGAKLPVPDFGESTPEIDVPIVLP